MIWFWMAGALFTDGLLDPHNEDGFWKGLCRGFVWPVQLGNWVFKITQTETAKPPKGNEVEPTRYAKDGDSITVGDKLYDLDK